MFRALLLIPLVACCNTLTTAAEISKSISIIKSRDSSVYDATIAALDQRLEQRCKPPPQQACLQIETRSFVAGEEPPVPPAQDLVITLGLKAREYADRHLSEEKIINAMVPSGKNRLNESAGNGLEHPTLILDQPPLRSLLLIKHLIPNAERIGLLISRDNTEWVASIRQTADTLDLRLVVNVVDDEARLGRQLALMLDEIDVLLALPDVKIHNRRNVSSILLTTYRNRIPLIGFSSAYVKAGALAAIYSTPENIGEQLAELTVQALTTEGITIQPIYPKYFSLSINSRVARSLGLQLQLDPENLEQLIRDAER